MIHDIFMPRLSSTMTEGKIVEWSKSPGDKVEKGETVLVVESDKADMDVEAFYEGSLAVIIVEAGEVAPVDSTIGFIAETEAEIPEAKKRAESLKGGASAPAPAAAAVTAPAAAATTTAAAPTATSNGSSNGNGSGRTVASPRAKKLAKQLGVDLKSLQGSGPYGRITAGDVEQASGKPVSDPVATSTSVAPAPVPTVAAASVVPVAAPAPARAGSGETVPLNTLQKAVVQNMMASLQVPTFHVTYTITTDSLDKLYRQIKPKGVTMTALLAKAIAVTLKNHPEVNASYAQDAISYNSDINVAVAVAMPDGGLITPVFA